MRRTVLALGCAACLALILPACAAGSDAAGPAATTAMPSATTGEPGVESSASPSTETPQVRIGERPYSLGFTPFPHAVSQAAVDDAYALIAADGDLFAFHTTEGVPWTAASNGVGVEGYGSNIRGKWDRHRAEMDANPDHEVYLALTPLDDGRATLAPLWDSSDHMPIPPDFAGRAFDDPAIVAAYTNFVLTAVDWYEPDYLAIGIEGNLLAENTPTVFDGFATLMSHTYHEVKLLHPELPVFVTLTAVDLLEGWTDKDHQVQLAALDQLLASSDYFAVSFYPFMSVHLTEGWPVDSFEELEALGDGRPLAIAETGYPAQAVGLPTFGFSFDGTAEKQHDWTAAVLDVAQRNESPFVVNFIGRDYDDLWRTLGSTDLFAIWRDTGLYDENGQPRPALETWREALAEPRTPR